LRPLSPWRGDLGHEATLQPPEAVRPSPPDHRRSGNVSGTLVSNREPAPCGIFKKNRKRPATGSRACRPSAIPESPIREGRGDRDPLAARSAPRRADMRPRSDTAVAGGPAVRHREPSDHRPSAHRPSHHRARPIGLATRAGPVAGPILGTAPLRLPQLRCGSSRAYRPSFGNAPVWPGATRRTARACSLGGLEVFVRQHDAHAAVHLPRCFCQTHSASSERLKRPRLRSIFLTLCDARSNTA